jgi:hypothetical protein
LIDDRKEAVNPNRIGTKPCTHYVLSIPAGETKTIRLRLSDIPSEGAPFGGEFDTVFQNRIKEADEFYQRVSPFPQSTRRSQCPATSIYRDVVDKTILLLRGGRLAHRRSGNSTAATASA